MDAYEKSATAAAEIETDADWVENMQQQIEQYCTLQYNFVASNKRQLGFFARNIIINNNITMSGSSSLRM